MRSSRERAYSMLNRAQNSKYILVRDSFIVGIIVGIIIVIHRTIASKLAHVFMEIYSKGRENLSFIPIIFILLIALGYFVAQEVKKEPMISGSGIPQVEGILTRRLKMNWFKILINKFVGGLICLGAGLSVGREGPSVQMGACVGEGVSKQLNKLENEEKYLITSGASAGLSGAFNAPLSGVMFALEETHKNFSPQVLLSAMIASVTADFVAKQFFGIIPSLHFSKLTPIPLQYYWVLIILGITIGISGVIFNKGILKTQSIFKKSKMSIELKIIIPFILTGFIGLISPILLGGGHELIMSLQESHLTINILIIFIIVKFIFTFISFGSGVPGGIFFPLLTIGALVGNVVGLVSILYLDVPSSYMMNFVVLAMAGHFAATVKAPITAIILILEMTGSLDHLLALSIVVIIAQLTSDTLNSHPIYESLLEGLLEKGTYKYEGSSVKKTLLEVAVHINSNLDGKCIKDVYWPNNCLVVAIARGDTEIIPKGETEIIAGDYLTVMTEQSNSADILDKVLQLADD
ncbi:ClC family H(+)/Cl(-) exchange transporter [Romboutsia sp.]|uniref:ClC family H(+)/Cl(-) exchange transporter n=1 Tax=Romboutsia sp. TaxID=1965302 RepID=UPI002B721DC4|nr:ClC family H(+)/Cl(-) exchange transporter [Romboutsia sp.]HSQ87696.1 ClC family H(+)/Cl(-) exchange transporter [Romboutsia sp.]